MELGRYFLYASVFVSEHIVFLLNYWHMNSSELRRSIAIIENADQIIDLCFKEIKECDLFVFLLSDRHGTGVLYSEHRFYASYLELELFAAAMLRKPVLVLHQRDRNPEGPLEDARSSA